MARGRPYVRRCPTGKYRFHDRIDALLALADSLRKSKGNRNEVRAYSCSRCDGWHLTSKALYTRPELQQWQPTRERYQRPRLEQEHPKGRKAASDDGRHDRAKRDRSA